MKVVTLEELKKMPDGTVFVEFDEGCLLDDIAVLARRSTEKDGSWLYGAEYITPSIDYEASKLDRELSGKEWIGHEYILHDRVIDDTSSYDYDNDTQFAIFNEDEIVNMIAILQDALIQMGKNSKSE